MLIKSVFDFNKAMFDGPYAWPGGYPLYFIMSDGEALSFKAVEENACLIRDAIIQKDNSGWRVVSIEVNYEDDELYCSHSGDKIECAYGED